MEKVVVFRLGRESYGVDIRHVREVVPWEAPVPLPGAPAHVEGILHLRGEVLPVMDLARRFRVARSLPDAEARIMVVDAGPAAVGLVVDEVTEVLALAPGQVQPVAAVARNAADPLVTGVARLPDRLVILVDLARVAAEAPAPGVAEREPLRPE